VIHVIPQVLYHTVTDGSQVIHGQITEKISEEIQDNDQNANVQENLDLTEITDPLTDIVIEISLPGMEITKGERRSRRWDLRCLKQHLQDRNKQGKGKKREEYGQDIEKNIQKGVAPVGLNIPENPEEFIHPCKDRMINAIMMD